MRAGRSVSAGYRAIRRILAQFGNGATNINELKEEHYAAVIAAVTIPTLEDHYGSVTDVAMNDVLIQQRPPRIPTKHPHIVPAAATYGPQTKRIKSPLSLDLEARLATARAKTKRSVPGGRVNLGNASRVGDQADDVVRDFPAGERMS